MSDHRVNSSSVRTARPAAPAELRHRQSELGTQMYLQRHWTPCCQETIYGAPEEEAAEESGQQRVLCERQWHPNLTEKPPAAASQNVFISSFYCFVCTLFFPGLSFSFWIWHCSNEEAKGVFGMAPLHGFSAPGQAPLSLGANPLRIWSYERKCLATRLAFEAPATRGSDIFTRNALRSCWS
jgi:hypothetical protein